MPALQHLHSPNAPAIHRGVPRFSGDWVDAAVVLGHGTVRIDTFDRGYILMTDDFQSLRHALGPTRTLRTTGGSASGRAGVQFNAQFNMLLVPGGHARAGRSFFPLHPAPSTTWHQTGDRAPGDQGRTGGRVRG
ncbi:MULTISPECIES: hypothetical protein [Micrococcaceae]|uniref:Uncharacterized protein n=1 Tax=Arthrobacter rhombi TaxID=71253 RepID=A0A1R4FI07_9MICC|nr:MULTISPECIES: hypothetical protein [Micrococcaceae]PCC26412.1 hypothetical protein CIK75_03100 [Glutamicibacter sp. BW78]SJM55585.1 hypothetical protein FM101_04045 [Arthrobacter rhombi]